MVPHNHHRWATEVVSAQRNVWPDSNRGGKVLVKKVRNEEKEGERKRVRSRYKEIE